MATKPKVGGSKKKAAKSANPKVPKTQSERFIETARSIGVTSASDSAFEQTFEKIVRKQNRRSQTP